MAPIISKDQVVYLTGARNRKPSCEIGKCIGGNGGERDRNSSVKAENGTVASGERFS